MHVHVVMPVRSATSRPMGGCPAMRLATGDGDDYFFKLWAQCVLGQA
jgi:hypothetical protein